MWAQQALLAQLQCNLNASLNLDSIRASVRCSQPFAIYWQISPFLPNRRRYFGNVPADFKKLMHCGLQMMSSPAHTGSVTPTMQPSPAMMHSPMSVPQQVPISQVRIRIQFQTVFNAFECFRAMSCPNKAPVLTRVWEWANT